MRPDFFDLVVVGAAEAAVSVHFDAAVEVAVVPLGGASLCRRLFVFFTFSCFVFLVLFFFLIFGVVRLRNTASSSKAVSEWVFKTPGNCFR